METKYYNRFFDLYKPIHNVVFTIDAELIESSDNCTIELRNIIQQILLETNEFDNISLDAIIDELKQILLTKTKENKEYYIIDILEHWVEYAPYFDTENKRDTYWIKEMSVDANTDFYKTAKEIVIKNKTLSVRFNASIFEKYIFCCYEKRKEFFDRLNVTCKRLDIDFGLLQEKVGTQPQITATKDYSELLKALSKYISGISSVELANIIENHSLLNNHNQQANWIGKPVDAHNFATYIEMTLPKWNKCFSLPNGNKLKHNNKDQNQLKDQPIIKILQTHLEK